jgi:hypothetical protein
MTHEELRIACAEKCGWRIEEEQNIIPVEKSIFRIYHNNYCCEMIKEYSSAINLLKRQYYPDYEHDRNALFELVKTIPKDKRDDFIKALADILGFDLQLFTDGETLAGNIMDVIWDLLIADPIAIMRAFLTVMDDNR